MNIKNMNFYYLREHRKVDVLDTNGNSLVLDFTSLTLFERLILSAVLTYLKQGGAGVSGKVKPRHIVNIVYGVDDAALLTTGQLTAFSKLATDIIVNKAHMVTWLIDNIGKKTNDDHGNEKDFIKCITINSRQIFATRNGKDCKSLDSIAWRAAALNAATAKNKLIYDFQSLSIFNWLNSKVISITDLLDSASENEYEQVRYNFVHNKGNMKKAIQNWLDAVGIDGEFDRNSCIIKGFKERQTIDEEAVKDNEKLADLMEQQKPQGMEIKPEISVISNSIVHPKGSIESQLDMDLELGENKWEANYNECIAKLGKEPLKKINRKLAEDWLKPKCKEIAKHFKVNSDMVYGFTQNTQKLSIPDKTVYFGVKDSLRALKNETFKMVCDDEDEYEFEDPTERKFAKAYLFRYYWQLMNIK